MPTHKESLRLLSISQLHEVSGRSREFIRKELGNAKLEPAETDGKTVWFAAPAALEVIFGKGDGLNPTAEKARLDAARADLAELELRKKRGEVVEAADAEDTWSKHIASARSRFRTVAKQMVLRVPGFTRAMAKTLTSLQDEAMHELAGDRPDPGSKRSARASKKGVAATA